MIGNFFRTRSDKKKAPVRASFRPILESLEERVVLSSSLAGGQAFGTQTAPYLQALISTNPTQNTSLAGSQAFGTQTAPYLQALMSATPTQLTNITQDMATAGAAGLGLLSAGRTTSPTSSGNANYSNLLTQYIASITDLMSQMSSIYQSYANSATSASPYTSVVNSNPFSVLAQSPYFSSLQQPNPIAQTVAGNATSSFGGSSLVAPTYSGQYVGY